MINNSIPLCLQIPIKSILTYLTPTKFKDWPDAKMECIYQMVNALNVIPIVQLAIDKKLIVWLVFHMLHIITNHAIIVTPNIKVVRLAIWQLAWHVKWALLNKQNSMNVDVNKVHTLRAILNVLNVLMY